jgi:hypothetical protein
MNIAIIQKIGKHEKRAQCYACIVHDVAFCADVVSYLLCKLWRTGGKQHTMGVFERHRYPADWEEMALDCKMRAGWRCEHCGAWHGEQRIGRIHGTLYTVFLAACHVNHDPENPDAVLASLCQSCHLRHDGVQHGRTRKRKHRQAERSRQRSAGQLDLFHESQ